LTRVSNGNQWNSPGPSATIRSSIMPGLLIPSTWSATTNARKAAGCSHAHLASRRSASLQSPSFDWTDRSPDLHGVGEGSRRAAVGGCGHVGETANAARSLFILDFDRRPTRTPLAVWLPGSSWSNSQPTFNRDCRSRKTSFRASNPSRPSSRRRVAPDAERFERRLAGIKTRNARKQLSVRRVRRVALRQQRSMKAAHDTFDAVRCRLPGDAVHRLIHL